MGVKAEAVAVAVGAKPLEGISCKKPLVFIIFVGDTELNFVYGK